MARLPRLFRTRSWVPWEKFAAILGQIRFFFHIKMVYYVYSLESPHRGDSNEYTQYTFMLQKIKEILIKLPVLALLSTLIGSNYPFLELIFMVPEVFEPLKFDCNNNNHDNYDNDKKIMRTSVSELALKPMEKLWSVSMVLLLVSSSWSILINIRHYEAGITRIHNYYRYLETSSNMKMMVSSYNNVSMPTKIFNWK